VREEVMQHKPGFGDIRFHFSGFTKADMKKWLESVAEKVKELRKFKIDGWGYVFKYNLAVTNKCC
jgi:hypothetical protein